MASESSLSTHHSVVGTALSSLLGVALMVLGLWVWQHASRFADGWVGYGETARPDVATWAFRSGAIAIAALAQGVFIISVWGRLYPRQVLDDVLKVALSAVFAVAVISAVVLGFAAR